MHDKKDKPASVETPPPAQSGDESSSHHRLSAGQIAREFGAAADRSVAKAAHATHAAATAAVAKMGHALTYAKTGLALAPLEAFECTVGIAKYELAGELNDQALARLPQPGAAPAIGSDAFEKELDDDTHSQSRDDDDVRVLFDGMNSFAERLELINNATESIELQTFIFTDDSTGDQIAAALAGAARRGVKVRVIYDAVGSSKMSDTILNFLRGAGCEVRATHVLKKDPLNANMSWHEKHLIVDGSVSIEGGMNIADEYAFGGTDKKISSRKEGHKTGWRDTDVEVEGEAAGDAQTLFLRNWDLLGPPVSAAEAALLLQESTENQADKKSSPAAGSEGSRVRMIEHRPLLDHDNNTENAYLLSIASAEHEIVIENAYFIPPPELVVALIAALGRGVKVRILTNSVASTDNAVVADASRYSYPPLLAGGAEIREEKSGTIHAKTMEVDGKLVIIGSANLNNRSKGHDTEDDVLIEDPLIAAQLEARYAQGTKVSNLVTLDELMHEKTWTRLKEWGAQLLSKTL